VLQTALRCKRLCAANGSVLQTALCKRGVIMSDCYTSSSPVAKKPTAGYRDDDDETLMQALVTAGALVALSDGRVQAVERDELVDFLHRQGFVPTIPRHKIAEAFRDRARQLGDRESAQVIVETLRPLSGLSLSSIVMRTAHRVAAADGKIHAGELRAITLIRSIMSTLSQTNRPQHRCREAAASGAPVNGFNTRTRG
jgi:tellurite resistance protein